MKLTVTLIAVYFALAAAIVAGLVHVRTGTLAETSTAKAQADWDQWRAAAAKDTGQSSPVRRTVPSTAEPPMLVLMRDHFAAAIFGLLAPATALYVFFAWIVTGVARQSRHGAIPPSNDRRAAIDI